MFSDHGPNSGSVMVKRSYGASEFKFMPLVFYCGDLVGLLHH